MAPRNISPSDKQNGQNVPHIVPLSWKASISRNASPTTFPATVSIFSYSRYCGPVKGTLSKGKRYTSIRDFTFLLSVFSHD